MTAWLRRLFARRQFERDLDDEIQFHLEARARDLTASGVPAGEARRRALAEFGGTEPIKEAARDVRGTRRLDDFWSDVRYGGRAFRHQPGFAIVAVLTLTLGIGANTAIFSVVEAVLLRPLPVDQPERLVLFSGDTSQGTNTGDPFYEGTWTLFSTESYRYLRSAALPFTGIAAFESGDFTTGMRPTGGSAGAGRNVDIKFVSGNFFDVMGARPAQGRPLAPDDDRPDAPPVAVASDRFWRNVLGGDPGTIGRAVTIDLERPVAVTIVGVMPPSFFGVRVQRAPDLWVPISSRHTAVRERRDLYWLSLIGRLGDGQTLPVAQAAVTPSIRQFLAAGIAGPLSDDLQRRIQNVKIDLVSGARGISLVRSQEARLLVVLLSAVGVILLIACANVGTLLLARAAAREREIAVRRALGASRGRLVRQWLTESALLGTAGAILGAVVAGAASPALLARFVAASVPVSAAINGPVLAFTIGVTLLACLLFGLAPSLHAGGVDPMGSLRLAGHAMRRRRPFGTAEPLVVAQITMSLTLVIAATLLVRTLVNLEHAPFGFEQDRVLLASINPRMAGYTIRDVGALYGRIRDRIAAVPGVQRATFARFGPFEGHTSTFGADVEGYDPAPGETLRLDAVQVGPDYPETLGMPVLDGRAIRIDDGAAAPRVAMVNEAFAARFFPGRSPVGHSVTIHDAHEIVGVVKDAQYRTARDPIRPVVFLPMLQEETAMALDCEIEVRTRGDAGAMANEVRQAIASVDARVSIGRVRTLRDQVRSTFAAERTAAGFIVAFAAVALLVASVGLYGTVSHGLAKRTNEIGVRLALGAAKADLMRLLARETLVQLGVGLALGVLLAESTASLLASQLFEVTPRDPVSLSVSALVLAVVVALATVRPLLRALRIDPVVALRAE